MPLPRFFIGGALRSAAAGGPAAVTGAAGVEAGLSPLADGDDVLTAAVVLRTGCAEVVRKPLGLVPGFGAGVLVGFWFVIVVGIVFQSKGRQQNIGCN